MEKKQLMTAHSSAYALLAAAVLLGSIWTSVEIKSKGFTMKLSELERLQRKVHADLKILATQISALNGDDYKNFGLAGLIGQEIYAIRSGENIRFVRDIIPPKAFGAYKTIDHGAAITGAYLVKNVGMKGRLLGLVGTGSMPLNTPINPELLEDIRKFYGFDITVENASGKTPDKKPAQ